jgi:uncharacterized protein YndB with AHSA1/START domain
MNSATATAANPHGEEKVTLERTFDAPRELVFRMWTEPKRMAQWWGPHGFANPVCEVGARAGGKINIVMRAPDGADYPMTGTFKEVRAPEKLVFIAYAQDANGKPALEAFTSVTFEDAGGKTKMTLFAHGVGKAPAALQMLAGMQAGWTQSIERLTALVATQK